MVWRCSIVILWIQSSEVVNQHLYFQVSERLCLWIIWKIIFSQICNKDLKGGHPTCCLHWFFSWEHLQWKFVIYSSSTHVTPLSPAHTLHLILRMRIAFLWGVTVSCEHTGNEWLKGELNLEFQTQSLDFFRDVIYVWGWEHLTDLSGSTSRLSGPAVNWTLSQVRRVYVKADHIQSH